MVTARNYSNYFPYGVSLGVRNLEYAADVNIGQPYICNFGAPLALATAGIVSTVQMINGSAVTSTPNSALTPLLNGGMVPFSSLTKFDGWGRGLTFVASGANARAITVNGYDYLGQKMQWTGTMNGATPVPCPKAFAWITDITWASDTDTTTVNVGYNNVLGLPYCGQAMSQEIKDYAVAANAGTFVAGLVEGTVATATNADVRGTYLPVTVIPDGTHIFEIYYSVRRGNLHGAAQFAV